VPDDCVVFIHHQSIPNRWLLFNYMDSAKTAVKTGSMPADAALSAAIGRAAARRKLPATNPRN